MTDNEVFKSHRLLFRLGGGIIPQIISYATNCIVIGITCKKLKHEQETIARFKMIA